MSLLNYFTIKPIRQIISKQEKEAREVDNYLNLLLQKIRNGESIRTKQKSLI